MLNLLRRFAKDQTATLTVEVVLVMPILLWGYFGLMILFEGYRSLSSNIRVNYTISDLLSRETNAVNAAYIDGLNELQDVLTQSPHRTVLRVSVVSYDADSDTHTLEWSHATDGKQDISQATMATELLPHMPSMSDGEQLITVETWMAFVPFFDITLLKGLRRENGTFGPEQSVFGPFYFESIVATRPRFAGQLCWVTCI